MKTNIKRHITTSLVIAAALICTIGGISAYFTDKQSKANTFTVGGASILLTEPNWTDNPTISPNEEYSKDPTIKNTGQDAYVFLEVTIPTHSVAIAEGGTVKPAALTELFGLQGLSNDWGLVNKNATANSGVDAKPSHTTTYLYTYTGSESANRDVSGNALKCKALTKNATSTLFQKVKFANITEGQLDANSTLEINVTAYAINASSDFASSDPATIFNTLKSELN